MRYTTEVNSIDQCDKMAKIQNESKMIDLILEGCTESTLDQDLIT